MTDAGRARPPRFGLATNFEAGKCTIRLAGELDAAVVEQLREALAEADRPETVSLVVDVEKLSFIDSTGIETLVAAKHTASGSERDFVVARPSGDVKRIFDLVSLDKLMTIVED